MTIEKKFLFPLEKYLDAEKYLPSSAYFFKTNKKEIEADFI